MIKGRVLVTGADGFIGSHLVRRLLADGSDVTTLGRAASTATGASHHFTVDVNDRAGLLTAFHEARPDVVFHLAAVLRAPPADTVLTNTIGTYNALEAAVAAGTSCFINLSTADVYGPGPTGPRKETGPLRPVTPYGSSKLAAELLVRSFTKTRGLPTVNVRPFLVYGPGQGTPSMLIPSTITKALTGQPIEVGSPANIRDPIFVTDVVEGLLRAVRLAGGPVTTVNLGTGNGLSVRDIVEGIIQAAGTGAPVSDGASHPRATDTQHLVASTEFAESALGFRASVPLREGVARTVEWFRGSHGFK